MRNSLIGKAVKPELAEAFNRWYADYRDEWCQTENEYPDHLVAVDAWAAAIEAMEKLK